MAGGESGPDKCRVCSARITLLDSHTLWPFCEVELSSIGRCFKIAVGGAWVAGGWDARKRVGSLEEETVCGLVEHIVNQIGFSRRELTESFQVMGTGHHDLFVRNELALLLMRSLCRRKC